MVLESSSIGDKKGMSLLDEAFSPFQQVAFWVHDAFNTNLGASIRSQTSSTNCNERGSMSTTVAMGTKDSTNSDQNQPTFRKRVSSALPPMIILDDHCDEGQAEIMLTNSSFSTSSSDFSKTSSLDGTINSPLRSPFSKHTASSPSSQRLDSMTLKLLRGRDFPTVENIPTRAGTNRLELRIGRMIADQDDAHGEPFIEWFREHDAQTNLEIKKRTQQIFGGPYYMWTFQTSPDDKIAIALIDHDLKTGVSRPVAQATAEISVLLYHRGCPNPNKWITLMDSNDNPRGTLQLRLALKTTARVQKQETCPALSAGPGLLMDPKQQWKSYAVRKLAIWSMTPVMLNVYDVSQESRIENLNGYIKKVGAGGIFHAAIEINGREWSFGGTQSRRCQDITGVFASVPKQCPLHHYRETIYLGDCHLRPREFHGILNDLKAKWLAHSYNLFRKNCCSFSREFAMELGVGDIPEWVYSLATAAEFIEPYLLQVQHYLTKRAINAKKQQKKKKQQRQQQQAQTKSPPEGRKALDHQPQPQASTPPAHVEHILDHAMAAKIQRSFRRSNVHISSKWTPRRRSILVNS